MADTMYFAGGESEGKSGKLFYSASQIQLVEPKFKTQIYSTLVNNSSN